MGVAIAVVAMLALFAVPASVGWGWFAYAALAFATVATIRSTPREPGFWLGRRIVRRAVVLAVAADCVALLGTDLSATHGAAPGGFLILGLLLLNVVLGRATLRLATAPDAEVDERQEALRNRAHHLAYWLLAVAVGGTVLVAGVASAASRAWLETALHGGAWWVLGELLFVLPALTLAWLEPDRFAPEEAAVRDRRSQIGLGLLAVTVLTPFLLCAGSLVLPLRSTSSVSAPMPGLPEAVREPGAATPPAPAGCREFTAAVRLGLGAGGEIPLHALACWDGRSAYESWGLNQSDCTFASTTLALFTTRRCSRTTTADGTLHFVYTAEARPLLLPFLSRDVTVELVLDRNGTPVRFP
ncbi:MAG TPA: hypothetical protein VGL20_18740 [Candidatus Dormibacteraeota bacterium]